ncbi:hypothetical protein [Agromyces larvae]|uniref:Uncharacterized protein n=1 Tax=Agromyces larvae TaxID=2929802 RepID=A0ABY4C4R8_9MICO|nr:hypothetical protein [Agromyces larvae]UOE43735.1 hypothetical protein MTO99_16425 [Agromyces larvae]
MTKTRKWRVERAGAPTGGFLRGWLATSGDGVGAYFTTWPEAIDFATRQADEAFAREMHAAAAAAAAVTTLVRRELALTGIACRYDLHKLCTLTTCDCDCHRAVTSGPEIEETAA